MKRLTFAEFFKTATECAPYDFQVQFADDREQPELPQLIDIPTGLGKTAMAILGWLWRRRSPYRESQGVT